VPFSTSLQNARLYAFTPAGRADAQYELNGWTIPPMPYRTKHEHKLRGAKMPSRGKKPVRLEGMPARRLLDALGTARQAVISAQTHVKVAGPVYHGCQMVTSATDALAHLITGSPRYFHAQGTLGEPGEPNWTRDRQEAD
jgi:hypothetical protein